MEMDSLKDKLLKLKETLTKGMKNGGIGGQGAVKAGASLPSLPQAPKVGSTNSATPSVGKAPAGKKNPVKQAQQTQNKDIKDIKIKEAQEHLKVPEMVKYDDNGQWSLDKSDSDAQAKLKRIMGSQYQDEKSKKVAEQKAKIKSVMGPKYKSEAKPAKSKTLRRKPGEKKAISKDDRKQKENQAKVEAKLKDPAYKQAALVHNAKKRITVREKNETYDNAVKEHDPDHRPPVAQKKRSSTFIEQFNRRKGADDKKLINKEKRGEIKVVKKTAREEMIETLEKAKAGDAIALRADLPSKPARKAYTEDARAHAKRGDMKRAERAVNAAKDTGGSRMTSPSEKRSLKENKPTSPKKEVDDVTRYERKAASDESFVKFEANGQWSMQKSGYDGYTDKDNIKRKANNMSESTGIHTMNSIKQYGGSGADAAGKEAKKAFKMSAKNPTTLRGADGKATDVVHSSGRKKGKSVFESDEHKAQHLAELNKV